MRVENQLQHLRLPGARKAGRRSPNRGEMTGTRGRSAVMGGGFEKCLTRDLLRSNESSWRGREGCGGRYESREKRVEGGPFMMDVEGCMSACKARHAYAEGGLFEPILARTRVSHAAALAA